MVAAAQGVDEVVDPGGVDARVDGVDPELGERLASQLQDLLREVEAPIEQA